jgi:hypothetical protein
VDKKANNILIFNLPETISNHVSMTREEEQPLNYDQKANNNKIK